MRTLKDISLNRLIVDPEMSASSALLSMQKSGMAAAAVMAEAELIGIVTMEACILSDTHSPVREVMRGSSSKFQLEDPVRQAAKSFVRQQADFIPVYDGDTYYGLLSSLMLITELGRSWDPLTGLSWSDRLRDWGVECLESGQEITIVFFDLNNFGEYNKKFGHTIGDRVIWGFGVLLGRIIDPSKDVLVRYGGDEFAIGTIRDREQTISMLSALESREFHVDGIDAGVTFSYGISGGKRTHEPSRDHVAATLDNLINLASQDCISNKPHYKPRTASTPLQPVAVVSNPIQVSFAGSVEGCPDTVRVELTSGGTKVVAEQQAHTSRYLAIAEATARAINQLDPMIRVSVDDVAFRFDEGERRIVLAGSAERSGASPSQIRTEAKLNGDFDKSVARSVVKAVKTSNLI